MNKILIIIFLTITSCASNNSQKKKDCYIYLKPIFPIDLSVGANKNTILNYLENYQQLDGEEIKYTPKNIDLYSGSKTIILPNGYKSNTHFSLRFKDNQLLGYKAYVEIGESPKYFWEFLEIINRSDKKNVNNFINTSQKKPSYNDFFDNTSCKRMISVERKSENGKIFNIKIGVN